MQVDEDDEIQEEINVKVDSVRDLCKLRDSKELNKVLEQINVYKSKPDRKCSEMIGNLESDPEYQLIVEANSLAVEIDNEISLIHKFVKEKYQKRFPELDSLIMHEMDYIKAVKELRNNLDAKNNEILQQILTQATIMIVSVTASTTQGQLLTETELARIDEACTMAIDLNSFKITIYDYVESKMTFLAPNLSAIVGASTAAKLVSTAGGLTKLSKIPSCNLLVLGSKKKYRIHILF
jgi:U4/U6 small nuclear ribonucleoprotein PRP31